jgi:hypothetical protein
MAVNQNTPYAQNQTNSMAFSPQENYTDWQLPPVGEF